MGRDSGCSRTPAVRLQIDGSSQARSSLGEEGQGPPPADEHEARASMSRSAAPSPLWAGALRADALIPVVSQDFQL
eukprot:14976701-Alexandrium_andersonii.AAC.1